MSNRHPAFRRVALIGKRTSEIASWLKALREFLQSRGCEILIERETAQSAGDGGASAEFDEIGRSADLAIVVGGRRHDARSGAQPGAAPYAVGGRQRALARKSNQKLIEYLVPRASSPTCRTALASRRKTSTGRAFS